MENRKMGIEKKFINIYISEKESSMAMGWSEDAQPPLLSFSSREQFVKF